ncbi:MAG TPA: hypothetical protein VGY13_05480 [Solirubrobacteraceae bacterium]|jgi:hypothetical protein|nr:hypothetical protein [Solirubrobacteraceae bacterium]
MEKVLAALAQRDRIGIVLWLIEKGPARQAELLKVVQEDRGEEVNPGTMTALLKPLIDSGLLIRDRPRGPIRVRDAAQTIVLLRAAAVINAGQVDADEGDVARDFDKLRRALLRPTQADADVEASS